MVICSPSLFFEALSNSCCVFQMAPFKYQTAFLHSAVSMAGLKHSQLLEILLKGSVGPNDSGCHVSPSFITVVSLIWCVYLHLMNLWTERLMQDARHTPSPV